MYDVHLWLIGKRVVDFLLVLIEFFCAPPPPIIFAWIVRSVNNNLNFVADSFHTKKL